MMPLLVGLDLQELINRVGPVHPTAAARIARQACLALEIAHRDGVVHRDVKPANLYLDHDSVGRVTVRVLDFGVAKWADGGDRALTGTGSLLGTPLYMAPEQEALQSKAADARADVWSLGASLYCALAGRTAFESSTSLADLHVAITTTDMPLLQGLTARCSSRENLERRPTEHGTIWRRRHDWPKQTPLEGGAIRFRFS
jgi:serine/threonine protein kinase